MCYRVGLDLLTHILLPHTGMQTVLTMFFPSHTTFYTHHTTTYHTPVIIYLLVGHYCFPHYLLPTHCYYHHTYPPPHLPHHTLPPPPPAHCLLLPTTPHLLPHTVHFYPCAPFPSSPLLLYPLSLCFPLLPAYLTTHTLPCHHPATSLTTPPPPVPRYHTMISTCHCQRSLPSQRAVRARRGLLPSVSPRQLNTGATLVWFLPSRAGFGCCGARFRVSHRTGLPPGYSAAFWLPAFCRRTACHIYVIPACVPAFACLYPPLPPQPAALYQLLSYLHLTGFCLYYRHLLCAATNCCFLTYLCVWMVDMRLVVVYSFFVGTHNARMFGTPA